MAKGVSLHIGLNQIDQEHYLGLSDLRGPVNDARDMAEIAAKLFGYNEPTLLIDKEATSNQLQQEILRIAQQLTAGDIFLLTYSGHGSRLLNSFRHDTDEEFFDQTWCLYDRQFLDDELRSLLAHFQAGVRVLVVSDSCYSGTITKELAGSGTGFAALAQQQEAAFQQALQQVMEQFSLKSKAVPPVIANSIHAKNIKTYSPIQKEIASPKNRPVVESTVKLFSAAQDHQVAYDGTPNSRFTAMLKHLFQNEPWDYMTDQQLWAYLKQPFSFPIPNFYQYGSPNPTWDKQFPFII